MLDSVAMNNLLRSSYSALLAGATNVSSVRYDAKGYAPRWTDNVMHGLPLDRIESDFRAGAGRELERKLCAAHSSAALAVNAFGPWVHHENLLTIGGITSFHSMHFEAKCPTGLSGTPPNLDMLAEGDSLVAVESKCTEWVESKLAIFSISYDLLQRNLGRSPWFKQMLELRKTPNRYMFLDAAQLIKHAFGLLHCYKDQKVRLMYMYWEPSNAGVWPECIRHREEADDLAAKVRQSPVQLIPMSYRELWASWEGKTTPEHLRYLRMRYDEPAIP